MNKEYAIKYDENFIPTDKEAKILEIVKTDEKGNFVESVISASEETIKNYKRKDYLEVNNLSKENKWNDNIELSKEREYELFKEEIEKGISEGKYSEEEIIRLNNWLDSNKPEQK